MPVLSYYEGNHMISRCAFCGELVAEYICDKDGIPVETIYDDSDHECNLDE